jgi:hypothetical protein
VDVYALQPVQSGHLLGGTSKHDRSGRAVIHMHPQYRLVEWLLRKPRPPGDGNDLPKHVGVNPENYYFLDAFVGF